MRTVRWSFDEREVTAKEDGKGCSPATAPAAVAAPLPPVSNPASPVSFAPTCMVYFGPSNVVARSAVPRGRPASEMP